jgi:hypothetical protein
LHFKRFMKTVFIFTRHYIHFHIKKKGKTCKIPQTLYHRSSSFTLDQISCNSWFCGHHWSASITLYKDDHDHDWLLHIFSPRRQIKRIINWSRLWREILGSQLSIYQPQIVSKMMVPRALQFALNWLIRTVRSYF